MARERTFAEAARGLFIVSRVLQFIKHMGCLFLTGSKCIICFPAGTFRERQFKKIPLMSSIFSVFVVHTFFSQEVLGCARVGTAPHAWQTPQTYHGEVQGTGGS